MLRQLKYERQFEGGWKVINPGKRLVGPRGDTAQFMPARPDLNGLINKNGAAEGRVGQGQNSWVIDTLQPNDVLVVDLFGKVVNGTFAGDNLGHVDLHQEQDGVGGQQGGSARPHGHPGDHGVSSVTCGTFIPSAIADVTLTGINVPIRIGQVTVLPGDVLVSDPEG